MRLIIAIFLFISPEMYCQNVPNWIDKSEDIYKLETFLDNNSLYTGPTSDGNLSISPVNGNVSYSYL